MKKNIIVTGSEGFIGKELVKTLKKDKNNVIFEVDRKKFLEADSIEFIFINNKIDLVYHLAAQTSVFNKDIEQVILDNILCFVKIVELCNKYNAKLVYASSSTANPINITSIYGLSKKFDEDYAKIYCPTATGIRLHNVYSETNPREGTLMWHILNDSVITLYNNGENKRHFTHISDAVNGLIYASHSNEKLLNCYGPSDLTIKEFVDKHNVKNKKVVLLNEKREFDKEEQLIDDNIENIYKKEI